MRPKDMRRSKSASALQSAAAMSLKGSDPSGFAAAVRDSPALKLPAAARGKPLPGRVSTWSAQPAMRATAEKDSGRAMPGEDQLDQLQRASEEPRTARPQMRPMTPVLEEELEEGQQPDLSANNEGGEGEEDEPEDEEYLHHMEDVESTLEAELQAALNELAGYMQSAKIDELNGDLRLRMAQLPSRMKTLDQRGKDLEADGGSALGRRPLNLEAPPGGGPRIGQLLLLLS
eukprot:CAMPEP_0171186954 /NCGR_PEP_ID=MMETSP0790-20130122/17074_1 /TAXON_ID=2925 /ORGANISM="Alexandrium catenella, Strain OF101" /LENGTH=230 /DNA_ID=CAMNT_0011652005 /DNA_START=81 /DNA_END=771 /DNA_ORIENTATION=+